MKTCLPFVKKKPNPVWGIYNQRQTFVSHKPGFVCARESCECDFLCVCVCAELCVQVACERVSFFTKLNCKDIPSLHSGKLRCVGIAVWDIPLYSSYER
jgi:hypothetical protein